MPIFDVNNRTRDFAHYGAKELDSSVISWFLSVHIEKQKSHEQAKVEYQYQ